MKHRLAQTPDYINKKMIFIFPLIYSLFTCISCSGTHQLGNGEFEIELDGITIHYMVRGKGPAMIVGHPNSGKIGYELTLKPLENQFTMVYYDPRGTGKSAAPKTLDGYNYEHLVKEIDLLRIHLGLHSIWLFGHSDQSEIALQYAIDYPDKISGLILSGTHFVATNEIERQEKQDFEKQRKKQAWFSKVVDDWEYKIKYQTNTDSLGRDLTYAPLMWWCYDSTSAAKVIPIYDIITKTGRRKAIDGQFPFLSQAERTKLVNRTRSYQSGYSEINTNVLILQGSFDTNNPPELVEKLHQEITPSELVFIEKSGHFPGLNNLSKVLTKYSCG